jgi:hypothetical protein
MKELKQKRQGSRGEDRCEYLDLQMVWGGELARAPLLPSTYVNAVRPSGGCEYLDCTNNAVWYN